MYLIIIFIALSIAIFEALLLVKIGNKLKKFKKYISVPFPGIPDSQPNSFKEFILYHNTPKLLKELYKNLDEESIRIINSSLQKILHLPDTEYLKYYLIDKHFLVDFKTTNEKRAYIKRSFELSKILKQYKFPKGTHGFSYIFYSDINLKFANNKLKNYIRNKIFIDGGAYIGDCALIMAKYSPQKIYSFDISQKNIELYKSTMSINKIDKDLYEINEYALSNKKSSYKISSRLEFGGIFENSKDKDTIVESVDIDSFLQNRHLSGLGLVHADVQGALCEMIIGMRNTIRRDRPVLSLDISNSAKEFFYAKPILEQILKNSNYTIKIINYDDDYFGLVGLSIFAYPKELDY